MSVLPKRQIKTDTPWSHSNIATTEIKYHVFADPKQYGGAVMLSVLLQLSLTSTFATNVIKTKRKMIAASLSVLSPISCSPSGQSRWSESCKLTRRTRNTQLSILLNLPRSGAFITRVWYTERYLSLFRYYSLIRGRPVFTRLVIWRAGEHKVRF